MGFDVCVLLKIGCFEELLLQLRHPGLRFSPCSLSLCTLTLPVQWADLGLSPHAAGRDYNQRQLAGWYTRAVRDEVLAEWVAGPGGFARLHVYCHVSGEEAWPAPPALRSFIFQREMALVLDTLVHAEAALLEEQPRLRTAPVRLHLRSHLPGLNQAVEWGTLGDRASRPAVSTSLTPVLLGGVQPLAAGSRERRQPRQQHSSVAPLASSRLAVIAAASSQHDSESHS